MTRKQLESAFIDFMSFKSQDMEENAKLLAGMSNQKLAYFAYKQNEECLENEQVRWLNSDFVEELEDVIMNRAEVTDMNDHLTAKDLKTHYDLVNDLVAEEEQQQKEEQDVAE